MFGFLSVVLIHKVSPATWVCVKKNYNFGHKHQIWSKYILNLATSKSKISRLWPEMVGHKMVWLFCWAFVSLQFSPQVTHSCQQRENGRQVHSKGELLIFRLQTSLALLVSVSLVSAIEDCGTSPSEWPVGCLERCFFISSLNCYRCLTGTNLPIDLNLFFTARADRCNDE